MMSDTDDTDILLNSDPMGGLFLGLSLKELADKHKSLLPLTNKSPPSSLSSFLPPSTSETTTKASRISKNDDANHLESSDYFNSQGELILSELSEWTDSEIDKEDKPEFENESDGGESDSSFTYKEEGGGGGGGGGTKAGQQGSLVNIDSAHHCNTHHHKEEIMTDSNIQSQQHEIDVQSTPGSFIPQFLNHGRVIDINLQNPAAGWNIPLPSFMQMQQGPGGCSYLNEKGDQIFTRAPNFRSPEGYKPPQNMAPPRNLSEEEIRQEVKKMYENPDEVDKEHQGSSRPTATTTPKVLRFADNVTMLENANAEKVNGQQGINQSQPPPPLGFNFLSDNHQHSPIKFESQKCSSGGERPTGRKKQIASKGKRKSTKFEGAGDCASNSSSSNNLSADKSNSSEDKVPTLAEGVADAESPTVNSTPRLSPPTNAGSGGTSSSVPYCTKVIRGLKRSKPKPPQATSKPSSGFSFGYGESENELSPIRRVGRGDFHQTSPSYLGMQNNTKGSHPKDEFHDGVGMVKGAAAAMEELKTIWREIQTSRVLLRHEGSLSSGDEEEQESRKSFIEDLGKVDKNDPQPSHSENSSVHGLNSARSYRTHNFGRPFAAPPPAPSVDNFDSDLETLLNEADINPSDFEDIVDDLNIADCDVGAGIDDLLKEIIDPDTLQENKEGARLSHWAQSGAVEYVEKYYEEKFRRQECEEEIDRLQKENLNIRQKNAVLEGTTKRKDATIAKTSKAWKEVSTEWKAYEGTTRAEFERLKIEHGELTKVCGKSKDRVEQYEKELIKSVELADSFKTKLVEIQESKDTAVAKYEIDVASLNATIETLSKNISEITEEKKAAVRALKESHIQFDNLQSSFHKLDSELHNLKTHDVQTSQKLSEIVNQKFKLDSHLEEMNLQNEELRAKVKELMSVIECSDADKERVQAEHENSIGQKLKEEGERLHEYYNKMLQDALKSAAEKTSKAQHALKSAAEKTSIMVESMKKTNSDSERKLAECRERYHSDLTRMKTIYEVEMQELKKDNMQKQLLISTTAQQLQSGGIVRSDIADRLQSIVTNFPTIRDSSKSTSFGLLGQGDRIDHATSIHISESIREKVMKDVNNTTGTFGTSSSNCNKEYAKFVQNLSKSNATKNTTLLPKSENLQSSSCEVNKLFSLQFTGDEDASTRERIMNNNKSQSKPSS